MSFKKICDPPNEVLPDADYHRTPIVNNKIWIFSKTYVDMPTFHYGHRVSFAGGYSIYFDTETNKWSQKKDFPLINENENMEEVFFVLNSQIFLLLYTAFGGIQFKRLFIWDEDERKWSDFSNLQVGPACSIKSEENDRRVELIVALQDQNVKDEIIFVASIDGDLVLYGLSLDSKGASISLIHKFSDQQNYSLRLPVQAARWKDEIFIISGVHGCGFRIEPNSWIGFNKATNEIKNIQLDGDSPPFSFCGSPHTEVLPSGEWVHATGPVAHGMTNSRFNGEIWSANLSLSPLKWTKSHVAVPDIKPLFIAISQDGQIYISDNNDKGVLVDKI